MRLLMVNDLPLEPGPGSGGAEVYAARLVSGLERAGHEVRVFTGAGPHGRLGRALTLWDPWVHRRLGRVVREWRPDVVHVHNALRELSVSAVAAAAAHAPVVLTVHDFRLAGTTMGQGSAARNLLDARVKQPLDAAVAKSRVRRFLAVSEVLRAALEARGFERTTWMPHPAPEPVGALHPPSTSRDVVLAGRLSADKGGDVLVRAMAGIPDARLVIAGDGPERGHWEGLAAGRAVFTGRLDQPALSELLGRARLVAVPSVPTIRPEGASLIGVEAAMHGRPVVHSDDPAVAATMEPLGNGLRVAAGDVEGLRTALRRVLDDDDLADRLGAAGRRAAQQRHSLPAVVALHEQVYDEVRRR